MDKIIFWPYLCFEIMNGMCSLLFTVLEAAPEGQPCISVFSTTSKEEELVKVETEPMLPPDCAKKWRLHVYNVPKITQLTGIRKTLLFICLLPKLHSFLCDMFPLLRR